MNFPRSTQSCCSFVIVLWAGNPGTQDYNIYLQSGGVNQRKKSIMYIKTWCLTSTKMLTNQHEALKAKTWKPVRYRLLTIYSRKIWCCYKVCAKSLSVKVYKCIMSVVLKNACWQFKNFNYSGDNMSHANHALISIA